jgi:hypothetical protein
MLELFSGKGNLTKAICATPGLRCHGMDILRGPGNDIMDDAVYRILTLAIECQHVRYIHMAPPCATYSIARRPKIRTQCHWHSRGRPRSC